MTITHSYTKLVAVAAGVAVAFALVLGAAAPVRAAALTSGQISSIIGLLQSFGADAATIANVQASLNGTAPTMPTTPSTGGSMACNAAIGTQDLTVGSTGVHVMALQKFLNMSAATQVAATGAGSPGMETSTFGPATKAAVIKFQTANAITPAAGYVGPITRTTIAAKCGTSVVTPTTPGYPTTPTTPTTPSGLAGAGRLTAESSLGDVTSDLRAGDSTTAVVGVSFDATDGDVMLQRVDATFDMTSTSGSTNLDRYVSSVSLYLDGTKIASMDPADGDKNSSVFTFRFSNLGNAVIKAGQTGRLYVKVTPLSSIGTNEDGQTVTAKLLADSVRAVGSDGISDTYVATAKTGAFTVSSATEGTLTVTASGDNPVASQVAVGSSTTAGITLLTFNMKAKNSDATITDLVASFGTSDNNLSDVVSTVYLKRGSTVLKSATLSTGSYGTVTFTNINRTIAKDDTETYSIVADLKGDAAYTDGTTLVASTTVSGWDVEDENGASITPSAAAVGNTQTLTATGVTVVKGTPTTSTTVGLSGAGDTTQYSIPFTVTAGDNDVFIAGTTGLTGATTKIVYATTTTSTASSTYTGVAAFTAATTVTGDSAGSYYKVLAGTTRTFTLNVTYTAASAGYTGLQLSTIAYGSTSSLGSTYSSNLDTFKTNDVYMTNR
jgi:hypothetical protein